VTRAISLPAGLPTSVWHDSNARPFVDEPARGENSFAQARGRNSFLIRPGRSCPRRRIDERADSAGRVGKRHDRTAMQDFAARAQMRCDGQMADDFFGRDRIDRDAEVIRQQAAHDRLDLLFVGH
jgi:hypothetical protein